ncbi:hypothetical protein BDR03DRAFT_948604 [Suillus americanus]|nr:hypothetical protein BDR03DRAFT_948604 [Suillus americanus]
MFTICQKPSVHACSSIYPETTLIRYWFKLYLLSSESWHVALAHTQINRNTKTVGINLTSN